jgi:tetratricopeptide (TPR) repeat protein
MGKAFDCVTARVSLANALQAKGRFEQALPHLRRGLDLQPHEAARAYNLAACLLRLNRIDEAERFFREALRLGSKEPEKTWNGLGYCYLERRDWPGAVRCFRRAVQANPRYVFAHLSLSLAHERQGDRGAALEAARRAVEADPTSAAARERLEALERARPR